MHLQPKVASHFPSQQSFYFTCFTGLCFPPLKTTPSASFCQESRSHPFLLIELLFYRILVLTFGASGLLYILKNHWTPKSFCVHLSTFDILQNKKKFKHFIHLDKTKNSLHINTLYVNRLHFLKTQLKDWKSGIISQFYNIQCSD